MNVYLRVRDLKLGGKRKPDQNLRLEYSPPLKLPGGKRSRWKSLKLYIYSKPRNPQERQHNREVKELAEQIRSETERAMRKGRYGGLMPVNMLLVDYLRSEARTKKPQTGRQWGHMIRYVEQCGLKEVLLQDLDVRACTHFRNYLLELKHQGKLGAYTTCAYMGFFRAALRSAFKAELITEPLVDRFDPLPNGRAQREYLTMEELRVLARTPTKSGVREIALFSAMTGLRYSDLKQLQWQQVRDEADGCYLVYRQIKEPKPIRKPICKEARELLGERKSGPVFPNMLSNSGANYAVSRWIKRAGIEKTKFTFHSFRHTFATNLLAATGNIKAVQEAIDHSDVRTTQIYAHMLPETVRQAVDQMQYGLEDVQRS